MVDTHNFTVSNDVRKIAEEDEKDSILNEYGLLYVFTNQPKRISFALKHKVNDKTILCGSAIIDNSSAAAFLVRPGVYYYQDTLKIEARAGEIMVYKTSTASTYQIQNKELRKTRFLYLTKEIYGTDPTIPAVQNVPGSTTGMDKFWHYTGKVVLFPIITVREIVHLSFYSIATISKFALMTTDPLLIIGGGVLYLGSFWALPEEDRHVDVGSVQTTPIETQHHRQDVSTPIETQYHRRQVQPQTIRPNVYAPGIHEDQYGRPVRTVPY